MIELAEKGFRVPVRAWLPREEIEPGAMDQLRNAARHPDAAVAMAVMPDCHVGFGVTIGCVMPTAGAVIPNAVGVDIGCFTGDTNVPTLDGRIRPIRELAEDGGPIFVYASTPDGKVVGAAATATRTRRDARLVEVELDNGARIRCTPDHRFMLRDGRFWEAHRLPPSTSLMPLYRRRDRDGYTLVQQNYSGRWHKAHWLVGRSGLLGPVPRFEGQRTVLHHRDFDETNNDPSNLELMGNKDHSAYHRLLVERNVHWHSPAFEEARIAALSEKAATAEGHAYFAERGTRNIQTYMEEHRDEFLAAVAANGDRGRQYLQAYNTSTAGRAKSREVANRFYECGECGEQVRSPIGLYNHRRKAHSATFNHTVVAVRLVGETAEVYCLNVPGYHNFALEAGVFVHNCGMCAVDTGVELDRERMGKELWRGWMGNVQRNVPTGFSAHKRPAAWAGLDRKLRATALQPLLQDKAAIQLGTLGGGNHFLEAQVDERGVIWLMVHSGSRHTGLRIADHYHKLATALDEKRAEKAPRDLASLGLDDQSGQDYLHDMTWATDFALESRQRMIGGMAAALATQLKQDISHKQFINIHHNFAGEEEHGGRRVVVHRKGATSAREGELGIIPGSMGTPSYIVRGRGNPLSLESCSHGAGRRMSRSAAKKAISEQAFGDSIKGTYSKASMGYVDEAPAAYKDIETVIGRQVDLIDVVHTLRPVATVKGDSKARED